jgi:hypothetical protein
MALNRREGAYRQLDEEDKNPTPRYELVVEGNVIMDRERRSRRVWLWKVSKYIIMAVQMTQLSAGIFDTCLVMTQKMT